MKCKKCRYILFGVSGGRCPECGHPFAATEFAFPGGSVNFLCTHCGQGYLGNDVNGLPHPRLFRCGRCRRFVRAEETIVRPMAPNAIGQRLMTGNAWDHRARSGLADALFTSIRQLVRDPDAFFGPMYIGEIKSSSSFLLLCAYAAAITFLLFVALISGRMGILVSPGHLMIVFVFAPLTALVWVYVYATLIQMMLSGREGDSAGFDGTVQVVSYAMIAWPLIPILPLALPAMAWQAYLVAKGLQAAHEIPRAAAWRAASIPILLAIACLTLSIIIGLL